MTVTVDRSVDCRHLASCSSTANATVPPDVRRQPGHWRDPGQRGGRRRGGRQPRRSRRPPGLRRRPLEPDDYVDRGRLIWKIGDRSSSMPTSWPSWSRSTTASRSAWRAPPTSRSRPTCSTTWPGHQDRGQHDQHLRALHAGRQLPLLLPQPGQDRQGSQQQHLWVPGSGPATSPRPTPWPRSSGRVPSGSTATTSSTRPCRSAGTSNPAGAVRWATRPSRPTPRSRR